MNTADLEIIRYTGGRSERLRDTVVREDWLDLYVNKQLLLQTPVSDTEIEELIYGYLYAEGYLKQGEGLTFIRRETAWHTRVDREVKPVTMRELVDCAASKIEFGEEIEVLPAGPAVPAEAILRLATAFQKHPSLYHSTGGVHMAALAGADNSGNAIDTDSPDSPAPRIIHAADDISRRNAVDKVIGKVVRKSVEEEDSRESAGATGEGKDLAHYFARTILLVSGRISSDIVVRMLRTGIPLIVSKSAPTEKAVRIAEAYGVSICGFARGRRINIYSHAERIGLDEVKPH